MKTKRYSDLILKFLANRQDIGYHKIIDAFKKSKVKPTAQELQDAIEEISEYVDMQKILTGSHSIPKGKINNKGKAYWVELSSKEIDQKLKRKDINVRWWQVFVTLLGIFSVYYYKCHFESQKHPLKIVEVASEFQMIKLILKNEDSDNRYLKSIKIKIYDRDSLKGLISPSFTQPSSNDIINVALTDKSEYSLNPKFFVAKDAIEAFLFNLYHQHESPSFEFMKVQFEFFDDVGLSAISDTLYHYVGNNQVFAFADTSMMLNNMSINDSIIGKVENSTIYFTKALKDMIDNYKSQRVESGKKQEN